MHATVNFGEIRPATRESGKEEKRCVSIDAILNLKSPILQKGLVGISLPAP